MVLKTLCVIEPSVLSSFLTACTRNIFFNLLRNRQKTQNYVFVLFKHTRGKFIPFWDCDLCKPVFMIIYSSLFISSLWRKDVALVKRQQSNTVLSIDSEIIQKFRSRMPINLHEKFNFETFPCELFLEICVIIKIIRFSHVQKFCYSNFHFSYFPHGKQKKNWLLLFFH